MVIFRAVEIRQDKVRKAQGWAVERDEPDGVQIVVTRLYPTLRGAEQEAERLNHEAALRIMG